MCGLIAYVSKRPKAKDAETMARESLVNQYEEQYDRGQKGFGLISIEGGKAVVRRACEPVKFFFDIRDARGSFLMAHHRFPTSTDNLLSQTHPIATPLKNGNTLLVMHNGVINNATELFKKHTEELGYAYTTYLGDGTTAGYSYRKFNDSESAAIELARFIDGETSEIGAKGTIAFLALEVDKKGKPVAFRYGRNDQNPLAVETTEHGILIASEAYGEDIAPFEMHIRPYVDGTFGADSRIAMPFAREPVAVGFGSHSHHGGYQRPATPPLLGTSPAAAGRFDRDVAEVFGQRESAPEPVVRVSAFVADHYGSAMAAYTEMADEQCDLVYDQVTDSLNNILENFRNGELIKADVTEVMRRIATFIAPLVTLQDELEERAMARSAAEGSLEADDALSADKSHIHGPYHTPYLNG